MDPHPPQSHSSHQNNETLLHNPSNNHLKRNTQKKTMEKFQQVIIRFAETQPNAPLTPSRKTLLRDRLNQMVSQYKTPDHPPYSAMIERALGELNDKKGSSEDSISEFLENEYNNLPWAHSTFLKHHLANLCESGDIIVTRGQRYMLAGENRICRKAKRKRWKRKWNWNWEGQRCRGQKKQFLLNEKRNQRQVKEVENNREFDNEEHQLNENGINSEDKQVQEEKDEYILQPELSSPERPPGFESIRVENFSHLEPKQVEVASDEDLFESNRTRRPLRRRSGRFSQPQLSKADVVQVMGDNKFGQGRKMNSNKSKTISTNVATDVQSEKQTEFPLSNEQEISRRAPKLLRRSLRARRVKPEVARVCSRTVHKHRGRASKQKRGQNATEHHEVKVEQPEGLAVCTSQMEELRTEQVGPKTRRLGRRPKCRSSGKLSRP
ncbi:hypothetical protein BUALT_Bualt05G0112200 [Buddleja alternifolia]|uniref:H15 domain-containing protein n=1 Tax=Buddleja alternifolia TaxID=168488 RepID=A0AAV6XJX1_9LAMI|nr:hypothetical protein BUALT_Bualt05G0112200 [Buddleja alternifolia]